MKPIACFASVLLLSLLASGARAEVVLVVSADSALDNLTHKQVSKIFLGKSRRLPDGSAVVPLNQVESALEREFFYREFTGKSPAQVKAYWSKMIFTGRGQPPRELPNSEAVKAALTANHQAIAYIDSKALDDRVKIVEVE